MVRMRWLSFVLVAALVLAQALGAMHRIVHAKASAPGVAAVHQQHDGWVESLFQAHEDATCLLLDAVGHDGIPAAFALPAVEPPAAYRGWAHAESAARFAAQVRARGPPASFAS